jgi:homoserine dehydrogenase
MATRSLAVLKFGSSVLTDAGAIPSVVQELSRHLSSHDHIVAVVSAFRDRTDALENAALALCRRPRPDALAFYMGLGEMDAAGELTLGLQDAGIDAALRMPWDVSLVSTGSPLSAVPVMVSRRAFLDVFREHRVVVFPGFLGRGRDGKPHVLGRGGSDLTAIFLAAELEADRCLLLKSAPGIFEWDPAREGRSPRRYSRISWEDAARLGDGVLSPAHVEYARSRSVTIEVMAPGTSRSTTVGPGTSEFDPAGELEQTKGGRRE